MGRKSNNWTVTFPDVVGDVRVNLSYIDRRTDKSGGPTACWPWTAASHRQGYGMVGGYRIATNKKIMVTVHRVLLKQKLGYDPGFSVDAVHNCGNMRCVNPDHIIPGNPTVLSQIKRRLGRMQGGRAKGWRSSKPRQNFKYRFGVDNIRGLAQGTLTPEQFAQRTGCKLAAARRTLRYIQSGKSYGWAIREQK